MVTERVGDDTQVVVHRPVVGGAAANHGVRSGIRSEGSLDAAVLLVSSPASKHRGRHHQGLQVVGLGQGRERNRADFRAMIELRLGHGPAASGIIEAIGSSSGGDGTSALIPWATRLIMVVP